VLYFICLAWNVICMLAALDCKQTKANKCPDNAGKGAGLSVAWLLVCSPIAYCCVFQSVIS
jgi:hypothetical protein